MELEAALAGLRWSRATYGVSHPVELRCDSRYVIDSVGWVPGWRRKGWRTAKGSPVANRDLHEAVGEELIGRNVRWVWVRGHDGDPGNEAADVRARSYAQALKDGLRPDPGPAAS